MLQQQVLMKNSYNQQQRVVLTNQI